MKFYKEIVAELDGQSLNAESPEQSSLFHYHAWSTESIRRFWNIWTSNTALLKQFYPLEYWTDLLAWARERIRITPAVIADIGCGNGNLIECLMTLYPASTFVGVDMTESSLAAPRSRFCESKNIDFRVGSITELPLSDHSVDLITCTEVLEHTFSENFFESFKEIRRVLKSGGYYLASVPLGEKASFVCCPDCGSVFTPYQHMIFEIAQHELKELLSKNGLELIEWYQAIDRTAPENAIKRAGKFFLINHMPRLAKRIFPKSGVTGFLARACT